jgi:hypothetical protein
MSVEVAGGFASFVRKIDRTAQSSFTPSDQTYTVTYHLHDIIRFKGPFVAGGLRYRMPLDRSWSLYSRAMVGVVFVESTDTVTGTASTTGERVQVGIPGAGEAESTTPLFVMPEVGAEWKTGPWRIGAALGVFFVPERGRVLPREAVIVPPDSSGAEGDVRNAPGASVLAGERAYGPFALVIPQVNVAHVF